MFTARDAESFFSSRIKSVVINLYIGIEIDLMYTHLIYDRG